MSGWKVGRIKVTVGGYTPAPSKGAAPAAQAPPARDLTADRGRLLEIQAAVELQDFERAADLADAARRRGVEHPMVFQLSALKLEAEDNFDEALAVLRRAVELAPQDIGARNAAGLVLARVERYPEALAQFDAVLALQPDVAGAHAARGTVLEALGRPEESEAAYRRALELEPKNLGAVQGLANLLSRRGAHAEARPLAETVMAAEPNFPDAVMVLAAADAAAGAGERARQRLELLTGDERVPVQQRAVAYGLLGDILDAQNLTAEAFKAYAACNTALWRAYEPVHGQGPGALDFARRMLAELDEIPQTAWASAPAAAPRADAPKTHVFLLGFPRSGANVLGQALASHPGVVALEERETLADAERALLGQPSDLGRLAHAAAAELEPLRDAYWAKVRAEGAEPAGKVFVDNHSLNTFRLPLILKLFPEAKILFARRDPRDVVLSSYCRRFPMSRSAYQLLTLPGVAGYYDAAMSVAGRLQPAMADRLLVVRHEAQAEDFDAVVSEVCAFMSLPPSEAMRGFADRARAEGVGAWKRYREQLAPVLPSLASWAERYGYSAD